MHLIVTKAFPNVPLRMESLKRAVPQFRDYEF